MKKNIFNNLTELPESINEIDESTVWEKTGADPEKIKSGVLTEIAKDSASKSKNSSKHRGKKFTAIMIAAAILTAGVVSTTAFAAFGGFGDIRATFGKIFTGNLEAENVYDGSDLKINTQNENLNVKLLGIAGDSSTVYVSLELTNKDGSSLLTNPENQIVYTKEGYKNHGLGIIEFKDAFTVEATGNEDSVKSRQEMHGGYSGWGNWQYLDKEFGLREDPGMYNITETKAVKVFVSEDGKKINVYLKYVRGNNDLDGSTLNISCTGITEYIPGKILKSYNKDERDNAKTDFYNNGIVGELKRNEDGIYDFWEIEPRVTDTQFDLSVKLDYASNTKSFDFSKEEASEMFNGKISKIESVNVTVSPFGINIRSKLNAMKEFEVDPEQSKVIMKDGTEYVVFPVIENGDSEYDFVNAEYMTAEDWSNFGGNFEQSSLLMLDVDDIKTVVINGQEIEVNK